MTTILRVEFVYDLYFRMRKEGEIRENVFGYLAMSNETSECIEENLEIWREFLDSVDWKIKISWCFI